MHPRLILNYDQVYRMRYRGRGSNLTKARAEPGQQALDFSKRACRARIFEDITGKAFVGVMTSRRSHIYLYIYMYKYIETEKRERERERKIERERETKK